MRIAQALWLMGMVSTGQGPSMTFRVLIIGGTGQVGAAVVSALAAEPSCAEIVMVNRRAGPPTADPRVRQVVLDTADAQFSAEVTKLASRMVAQGDPVFGASCVGVGQGSLKWTEDELKALEIGVVGGFARGCRAGGITRFALLSAVGSTSKSRIRYVRIMGLKEETVEGIGFQRLAIFRPGIIAGNAHTPGYVAWLGRLIPGRFGTIEQDEIGRAFVAEFVSSPISGGVVVLEIGAMRLGAHARKYWCALSRAFRSSRDIAASGKEACHGDVLVERFPMKADAAQFDLFTFRRRCVEQAWKPRQRHAERPPVCQFDPHVVFVKADLSGRNGHAMLAGSDHGYLLRSAEYSIIH